jgi:putative transposase
LLLFLAGDLYVTNVALRNNINKTLINNVTNIMYFRKDLGHQDVPQEVAWNCDFYVTICAVPRNQNHLCRDPVGSSVLSSARHYEHLAKWTIHVVLLMPDHLHLVVTPHLGHDITELVKSWKRYLARTYRLPFQRNFFEHRIRNHETFYAHCLYIRLNPVRAGLVNRPEDWPWVYPILEGGCSD